MEDEVLNTEPTIVEQPTANDQLDTAVNSSEPTIVEQTPAVVEQPTPMDNNVTYDNIPKQDIVIDPNKDYAQNLVSNAIRIERDNNIINQSGSHISNFLNNEYDYDRNEAGTYWVAGAINDVNTQMSFLNSLIYEEMYDEMDLQKYYYDTTLATARAYAAQKKKETAYGYYRAAQEKAIAEAQLTGWYMPAEGQYMLGQYTVAQNVLEDPDANTEDKAKAERISNTVNKWFEANKISTRGIKCLTMMNYEENVRHNTIMGELQKEANKIAASSAAASAALADISLREFKFQVEEMEMQYGYNFSKEIGLDNEDYLGHNLSTNPDYIKYQALGGAENLEKLLQNPDYFGAILGARNVQWIKDSIGEEKYETYHGLYRGDIGNKIAADAVENNNGMIDETRLDKTGFQISVADKEFGSYSNKTVYTFTNTENGKAVTRCYVKDNNGVFHQITNKDTELIGEKILGDVVKSFDSSQLVYNDKVLTVGNTMDTSKLEGSYTNNKDLYKGLSENQLKTIDQKQKEGYIVEGGYYSVDLINADVVMSKEVDGKKEYYEVSNIKGDWKKIKDEGDVRKLYITAQPGEVFWINAQGKDIQPGQYKKDNWYEVGLDNKEHSAVDRHAAMINQAATIDQDENGNDILAYTNGDKTIKYLKKEVKDVKLINGSTGKLSVYTVIDPSEVNEDIRKKYETNLENYFNKYIPTPGKNASTIEAEQKEKNEKEGTVDLTLAETSNVTGSSGYEAQNTVEDKEASIEKTSVDLEDKITADFLSDLSKYEEEQEEKTKKSINYVKS